MKWISTTVLTLTFLAVFVPFCGQPASAQEQQAPTLQDMLPLLASGADDAEIFDQAMLANTRVPLQYLGVRITDQRDGREVSRDQVRHLLGQSRQDSVHQLIRQVMIHLQLPGYPDAETLIDIVDAAALASLRSPPPWLNIEFYDQRVGSDGRTAGGVSGRVPDTVHQPAPEETERQSLADDKAQWDEKQAARLFIKRGTVFEPHGENDFLMPLLGIAASAELAWQEAQTELTELQQAHPELNLRLYNPSQPVEDQVLLVEDGSQSLFALLVHMQSANTDLVEEARALFLPGL